MALGGEAGTMSTKFAYHCQITVLLRDVKGSASFSIYSINASTFSEKQLCYCTVILEIVQISSHLTSVPDAIRILGHKVQRRAFVSVCCAGAGSILEQ